jgi:hemerythrin-like domain-containing protein
MCEKKAVSLPTQPLRDEHRELLPQLEQVRTAADLADESATPLLDDAYDFLSRHLLPHAMAEEEALYPAVARAMGSPDATRTMEVDHAEVKRLTDQLGRLRANLSGKEVGPDQAKELRRVLYGLYTLVRVHFAKEEEVYLPLLDRALSLEEAKAMFEAMEAATARAKRG